MALYKEKNQYPLTTLIKYAKIKRHSGKRIFTWQPNLIYNQTKFLGESP